MSTEALENLDRLKGLWMAGARSKAAIPAAWRPLLDGLSDGEADLRLLALTGQATQVAFVPEPNGKLTFAPPFPESSLAPLPSAQRSTFRRALRPERRAKATTRLLTLIADRGYIVSPMDWFPDGVDESVPEAYLPWIRWINGAATSQTASDLTPETWDDFYPAERIAELRRLRLSKPADARALLAKKFQKEVAEARVRIIEALGDSLADEDQPWLTDLLANDRSGKVRAVAQSYLARLGASDAEPAETEELAAFFDKQKSLLGKESVKPLRCKNKAQVRARAELMAKVPLIALARAFGYAPNTFIGRWSFAVDTEADVALAQMVHNSASERVLQQFVYAVLDKVKDFQEVISPVLPRLGSDLRKAALDAALEHVPVDFSQLAEWASPALGACGADALVKSAAWRILEKNINKQGQDEYVRQSLFDLGLLASQAAAKPIIEAVAKLGIPAYDLRLSTLHLNHALPSRP